MGAMPSLAFRSGFDLDFPEALQTFLLKGVEEEQEEYPSLVGNGSEDMWMFSLRR